MSPSKVEILVQGRITYRGEMTRNGHVWESRERRRSVREGDLRLIEHEMHYASIDTYPWPENDIITWIPVEGRGHD